MDKIPILLDRLEKDETLKIKMPEDDYVEFKQKFPDLIEDEIISLEKHDKSSHVMQIVESD